ncbi:MAG: putative porin, partial [Cyclobacteriaceae bacterium]|nr:putative porin [Cyclobacteriaceae bacterium]
KQNELFWSDNVYPEGVFFSASKAWEEGFLSSLSLNTGHFIINTNGTSLNKDQYLLGGQFLLSMMNENLKVFPSFYYFNSLPDIPDGLGTFTITYPIFHLGTSYRIKKDPRIKIGADYYYNLADYSREVLIPINLQNQKKGLVANIKIGKLEEKGDWTVHFVYTYLQRYSAVDFFAQNDWTRWDYSSVGSPDGRLTNYKGMEIMVGYLIDKKIKLNTRYFIVQQLIPYGISTETGQRIRFDLDIAF